MPCSGLKGLMSMIESNLLFKNDYIGINKNINFKEFCPDFLMTQNKMKYF